MNTPCYPEYRVLLRSLWRGDFSGERGEGGEEGKGEVRSVSLLPCLPFSLLFSPFPQKRLILRLTSFLPSTLSRPPSLLSYLLFYATARRKREEKQTNDKWGGGGVGGGGEGLKEFCFSMIYASVTLLT